MFGLSFTSASEFFSNAKNEFYKSGSYVNAAIEAGRGAVPSVVKIGCDLDKISAVTVYEVLGAATVYGLGTAGMLGSGVIAAGLTATCGAVLSPAAIPLMLAANTFMRNPEDAGKLVTSVAGITFNLSASTFKGLAGAANLSAAGYECGAAVFNSFSADKEKDIAEENIAEEDQNEKEEILASELLSSISGSHDDFTGSEIDLSGVNEELFFSATSAAA